MTPDSINRNPIRFAEWVRRIDLSSRFAGPVRRAGSPGQLPKRLPKRLPSQLMVQLPGQLPCLSVVRGSHVDRVSVSTAVMNRAFLGKRTSPLSGRLMCARMQLLYLCAAHFPAVGNQERFARHASSDKFRSRHDKCNGGKRREPGRAMLEFSVLVTRKLCCSIHLSGAGHWASNSNSCGALRRR